jgi:hypothetical protein
MPIQHTHKHPKAPTSIQVQHRYKLMKVSHIQPDQLDPQSQSLSRSYGSVLPTSLTYIILSDQRLLTLETCCGYGYGQVRESTHTPKACAPDAYSAYTIFQGPKTALWTVLEPHCFTFTTTLSSNDSIPRSR